VNAALAAPHQTPALSRFPDSIVDLHEPHRAVLALVVGYHDIHGGAISWPRLLDYVVEAVSTEGYIPAASSLFGRNVLRTVNSVVGDLFDYELLSMTDKGLSLSQRAEAVRAQWNGEFTTLVDGAQRLAKDTGK
jgi:hypothetical protein